MPTTSLEHSVPVEYAQTEPLATGTLGQREADERLVSYVTRWRSNLQNARMSKQNVWNECWQLYRGVQDFSDKEDWQSKITLPKSWSSVKQATNVIKRILSVATTPYSVDPQNAQDIVAALRASKLTELVKVFLDNASWIDEFTEGLECGFVMGLGVWKVWWGLEEYTNTSVEQNYNEYGGMDKAVVRRDMLQGCLKLRAVDPYNFYWLPGSKLNRWVGTIEDIWVPKWELMRLAKKGVFDEDVIKNLQPTGKDEYTERSFVRFGERERLLSTPNKETDDVLLTDYYGPIVIDDQIVEEHGHILIANSTTKLLSGKNGFWHRKQPYVGYSPLSLPFRTEGVGLVEMVREVDKALSKLTNLSVDTLLFRLMPLFEVNFNAYENPEDFETGITPGKIFRRNNFLPGTPGIQTIAFEDVSGGAVQVAGQLDRSHQEGAMVSEIQQSIPRVRGYQSATEIDEKSQNQNSFFGSMAADIERQAIAPMVEMSVDLILQFLNTANDPRVASILGVDAQVLRGMSREDIVEMIQGEYKIKVTGITGQLEKAEMLQNLVQLMNIIGQNAEAWTPYLNRDALLRRILEAFRPAIHDIEEIIADPETIKARIATAGQPSTAELMALIPQLVQLNQNQQEMQMKAQQQMQEMQAAQEAQQLEVAGKSIDIVAKLADIQLKQSQMEHDQEMQKSEIALQKQELARARVKPGE